jgi:phospholipid/cholesterol/gamma-HCH transport system substrate-binding protein
MKPEVKIGIVTTIGILILAVLVVSIGDYRLGQPGYRFTVCFNYVSGLCVGAPVRVSGMDAGEVKRLYLKDNKVYVDVWVKESVKIGKDCAITINTLGLLGEKYVEVTLGPENVDFIKEGDAVLGIDPVNVSEILTRWEVVVHKMERTVTILDKLMGEKELLMNIDTTVRNLSAITGITKDILTRYKREIEGTVQRVSELSLITREIVKENRGKLKKAVSSFAKSADELKNLVASVDKRDLSEGAENLAKVSARLLQITEEIDPEKIDRLISSLNDAASSLDSASYAINRVVDENKKDLKRAITSFAKNMESLEKAISELLVLSESVGSGTIGILLSDPKLAESLLRSAENLEELSADIKAHPWKLLRKR